MTQNDDSASAGPPGPSRDASGHSSGASGRLSGSPSGGASLSPAEASARAGVTRDAVQARLLELVFAEGLTPKAATARVAREHPDRLVIELAYLLARIATELDGAFPPDAHWTYADWLEVSSALASDVYALGELGVARPICRDLDRLWGRGDPYLRET
ncbi:MAG: hypothetical protein ACU0CO_02640 [Shimia sp.]